MRILYITNEVNLTTGWGVVGYYTIKEISKKHNCDVITLKNADNVLIENVNYYPLLTTTSDTKIKMLLLLKDYISIRFAINMLDYDVIHFLVEPFFPLALFFSHDNIIFNIVGTYSDISFSQGINKVFYSHSLKKVNNIISISEYTKKRFLESSKTKLNVTTIPLGVDTSKYKLSHEYKKENSICFVGHIKERKGLIVLLQAFNYLVKSKEYQNLTLYLIGSDEKDMHASQDYLKKCKNFIEENNLSNYIKFTGQVSEDKLIEYYEKSKVNVLVSQNVNKHFEGFGLVHLEANALGTLTIGTLDSGNESAIVDGSTGYLVKQNDTAQLVNVLRGILDLNDKEYKIFSKNCIDYAISQDWKNYSNKIENIYKGII